MIKLIRPGLLSLPIVLVAAAAVPSTGHASGLMTACAADISSLCKGVKEGRGRISACLFAHSDRVSAECKPELSKVTHRRMFERMIPEEVRNKNDTAYEAALRKTCSADIKSLCSDVKSGEDRILACLYGWNDKLSSSCRNEAKTVLDHLR